MLFRSLFQRERSGRGQQVEISLQEAIYPALSSNLGLLFAGKGTQRTGNRHGGLASSPYNVYPSSDGYLAIICISEHQWRALTRVMGQPGLADDPRFATLKDRVHNMEELDALMAKVPYLGISEDSGYGMAALTPRAEPLHHESEKWIPGLGFGTQLASFDAGT